MNLIHLLIALLFAPPTEVDLAAARARASQALILMQQEKEIEFATEVVEPEPEVIDPPEEPAVRSVNIEWEAPVKAEEVVEETLYLVSENYCGACQVKAREWARQGIKFTKIDVATARAMGQRFSRIPHDFTVRTRKTIGEERPATAVVDSDTIPLALSLLADHLESQVESPDKAMKGLLDVDVDAPSYLPGLINDLLIGQRYSNPDLGLTAEWNGKRSMTVEKGRLALSPPVNITKTVGIITVKCTLDAVRISEQGQQIDLELGGSPDLTIRLRGYQATAPPSQEFFYREKAYAEWRPDDGKGAWTHESLLSHLRNGSQHKDKAWQSWPLELLTFGQLIAIHDDDHEGKI